VRRIELLTVMSVALTSGLAMLAVLIRILPVNADALFPLALTAAAMLIAGLLTLGVLILLARRNA